LIAEGKHVKGTNLNNNTYTVTIKDLVPEKLYVYQLGNINHGWSSAYSFLGPVAKEEHYPCIAVLGQVHESAEGISVINQLISRVVYK
jgi:hypothetical protein